MFSMNKYIGAHVEPYKPVDLTKSSTPKKRKAAPKDDGSGKKRSMGLQAPYRLSDDLEAVVGKSVLPRPQVTQALWAYIRENNLQVRFATVHVCSFFPCVRMLNHVLSLSRTFFCRILETNERLFVMRN